MKNCKCYQTKKLYNFHYIIYPLFFSGNTLSKMYQFLKHNKGFVNELYTGLNPKGFSEDCEESLIHKVVFALTNLLRNETDEKVLIKDFKSEIF